MADDEGCEAQLAIYQCCYIKLLPGRVAQSVTSLATDECLSADPGVGSSIRPGPILSWRLIMDKFLWPISFLPLIHSRRVVVS